MPLAAELQIALCIASPLLLPQLLSFEPPPLRLMLATWMFLVVPGPWAVTQLIPQITCANVPLPPEFSTLTATTFVAGDTPTTPEPLLRAPIVPLTWVPWPLSSLAGVPGLMQFFPLDLFRSGWVRSMPVSI